MRTTILLATLGASVPLAGQTWAPITSPSSLELFSCSFVSADTGWVMQRDYPSGANDAIYKTVDGGTTWSAQAYPSDPPFTGRYFNAVHFVNAKSGIITCNNYYSTSADPALYSTVLWTSDGGATWIYKDLGNNDVSDYDGRLVNDSVAYVIGQYGRRKKTTDAGATWSDLSSVSPYSGIKLFPLNADTVYYVGLDDLSIYGAFGRTLDGGASWPTSSVSWNESMMAIHFNDALTGWIGGYDGQIWRTNDGGVNWIPGTTGVTDVIHDIEFTDAMNGWAATTGGQILRTVDAGVSWQVEHNGTTPLYDLDLLPGGQGFAVGAGGLVLSFSGSVGLPVVSNQMEVRIHPNPCTSAATLIVNRPLRAAEVQVIDAQGREVCRYSQATGISLTLPTDGLAAGMYDLRIQDEGCVYTSRLIVAEIK